MMNSNYNVHMKPLFKDLGDALIWRYRLASVGITIIKIRRYHDHPFFLNGNATSGKTVFILRRSHGCDDGPTYISLTMYNIVAQIR